MAKAIAFVVLVVVLDLALGAALRATQRRTLLGEAGPGIVNLALRTDADVLVLGSSRAKHHVDTEVLGRELSTSVFNVGANGHDFLFAYLVLDLWTRRHAPPRAIVLHVDTGSFARSEPELQRLSVLAPYLDESERVREILRLRGPFERLKQLSSAYRYNGKLLAIVRHLFTTPPPGFAGFEPLAGALPPSSAEGEHRPRGVLHPVWDVKRDCLRDLLRYCERNHVRLLLVNSPYYGRDPDVHEAWRAQVRGLLRESPGAELVEINEITHSAQFERHPELFRDGAHLNAEGARVFSRLLASSLRDRLAAAGPARDVDPRSRAEGL